MPDRRGDLLAMSLMQAVIAEDSTMLELHLAVLGLSEEVDPEVFGVVRALSNALAATLTMGLGKEGALKQVTMWRAGMKAQSALEAET